MNPDPLDALQALNNARLSIRQGDRRSARRWAEKAVALNPDLEDAWLILASVASPRASVVYLQRVLRLNPNSERARKGLEWALSRLEKARGKQQDQADTRPQRAARNQPPNQDLPTGVASQSPLRLRRQVKVASSLPAPLVPLTLAQTKYRWSYLVLAFILVSAVAVAAFWPGNASPVLAFLRGPQHAPVSDSPVDLVKPTYTPTLTATFTSTPTSTSTPTYTPTFTPTETPTPTLTFTPTETPWPTSTPFQPATEEPGDGDTGGGVHWIDVDLSQQMLYAYEGNTIVASFLVSTGVAAFPTVVGQFHIYMKFEYTLMAGDGYYLPDVPYTMYFYRGYGIHGTYWHSNFGTPMSHGCVNMYTPDAQWLFYWAPMGTLVNVHY